MGRHGDEANGSDAVSPISERHALDHALRLLARANELMAEVSAILDNMQETQRQQNERIEAIEALFIVENRQLH